MKKGKRLYVLLIVLFFAVPLLGQEKKNNIKISGIAAHFIGKQTYQKEPIKNQGFYSFPIDFGVEAIYFRRLPLGIRIGTGFNYQMGRIASHISGVGRSQFNEFSIPVLLQQAFTLNKKSSLFITTGIYGGEVILRGTQMLGSADWYDVPPYYLEGYSDDTRFLDIYFDVGYAFLIGKKSEIACSPFLKYRVNTTWLNTHSEKLHYGFKLIYTFKF
ncbi:MAG: hypothetical protein L3J54_07850 [Draconibacterium sp.]|nr:hypothetical protein [Draconibacterium sp.]